MSQGFFQFLYASPAGKFCPGSLAHSRSVVVEVRGEPAGRRLPVELQAAWIPGLAGTLFTDPVDRPQHIGLVEL